MACLPKKGNCLSYTRPRFALCRTPEPSFAGSFSGVSNALLTAARDNEDSNCHLLRVCIFYVLMNHYAKSFRRFRALAIIASVG